ncbi:MAG: hypothetical protein ACI865_003071 [Flavobacteriaceae bacterium]|jgi:hypothetical protein
MAAKPLQNYFANCKSASQVVCNGFNCEVLEVAVRLVKLKTQIMNQLQIKASLLFAAAFVLNSVNAQQGYSSASMHWGKMNAEQKTTAAASGRDFFDYGMPRSQDIVVEEYFNYHMHSIALPKKNESIAIDLQWGNETFSGSGSAILQIGIATSELNKGSLADAPPVNVSIVIDKSGSMRADNRLINSKEAAREFVKRLRPADHISILAFDSNVEILLASSKVGNKNAVLAAIDRIQIGGSTDLNAGLVAAYGEVAKAYEKDQANKVIMLTDALTNSGVTDPFQIMGNSAVFNKGYDIDISMVGVGIDFNTELSRQITDDARSSIYFINDSEDIKKVFIDEVESLLCPVARGAKLILEFDEGIELEKFFGYSPTIGTNKIALELNNMNRGLTQIFLARFSVTNPEGSIPPVSARIEYYDLSKNKKAKVGATAQLKKESSQNTYNPLLNEEVRKNYAIASMAQGLHDMADHAEKGERVAALKTVDKTLNFVNELFDGVYDEDVQRVFDILKAYQTDMDLAINPTN